MRTSKARLLSLLLCLLLLTGLLLASCENESQSDTSSESVSDNSRGSVGVETLYTDANGRYTLDNLSMPTFNFSETEFRVCVYSNAKQSTYYSEEIGYDLYDTTDTVLNEAVKARNDLVESDYGVKIVACLVDDVGTAVTQDVTSSTQLYDAAMPFMTACATLAQDGLLYDLNDFSQYIHLEAPWWDQVANQSLSVAGKLYFTIGDISIMQKITSFAITFNKSMYSEYCEDQYGSLYDLVRNYNWTFDTMYEMGKLVTADTDGETGMTFYDTWGLSTANMDAVMYYLASGESLITKDASDLPQIAIGENQNSITVAQKILETLQSSEWVINTNDLTGQVDSIWTASLQVFGENRALFRTTAFSAIKKLRDYKDASDFGIVPLPLIYSGQDSYHTPSSSSYAYGICIPKGVSNPEFSAYMIEVLACGGKNYITPAYYDVTLKARDAKDTESEEMLDQYIFNNVVYDLGIIYNFGSISTMFSTLMASKSNNIVSSLDASKDAIEAAISECVAEYRSDF